MNKPKFKLIAPKTFPQPVMKTLDAMIQFEEMKLQKAVREVEHLKASVKQLKDTREQLLNQ